MAKKGNRVQVILECTEHKDSGMPGTSRYITTKNRKKAIDQALCVKCEECITACPKEYDAVVKVSPLELAPIIEKPVEEKKDV